MKKEIKKAIERIREIQDEGNGTSEEITELQNKVKRLKAEAEKLPFRVYAAKSVRVKDSGLYPLNADETAIDFNNPLTGIQLPKYDQIGENNHFNIYQLKKEFC